MVTEDRDQPVREQTGFHFAYIEEYLTERSYIAVVFLTGELRVQLS